MQELSAGTKPVIFMHLSFHGAAKTVTGTKHLVHLKNGKQILLDCGLFQGLGTETDSLNGAFGFDPKSIDALILSHAHIDHSGLIPKLVKDGFNGDIWCTEATRDLTQILLHDSAEIQMYDAEIRNKKRAERRLPAVEPLYTSADVEAAMNLFRTAEYGQNFEPVSDVTVCFSNTGHLVGSAAIHLTIKEEGTTKTLFFSGDVGRYRSVLLPPPDEFAAAEYIILESTYGNKHHDITFNTIKTLRQWIERICVEKGGKLIIPAFSVGRTQEVLYAINQLSLEKRLPEIPFFIDSPLSLKATNTVKQHTALMNDRLQQVMRIDDDPFHFPGLKYVEAVEDSQRLVDYGEPCVIISASGTADAGRVRHHIDSCIGNEKNGILFVGYCGAQSVGGQLLDGVSEIELFGNVNKVAADVGSVQGLSAHGDADDLCRFVSCQDAEQVKGVYLVHGEHKVQQDFAARLERKGFKNIEIPSQHQTYQL